MQEKLTINATKVYKQGKDRETGETWTMFNVQTSNGDYKSYVDLDPGTEAIFETKVKSNTYNNKTTQERWIQKFVGAVEGVKVGSPLRSAPQTTVVSGFTAEDRQMLLETFEMTKALYDTQNQPQQ